MNPQSYEEIDRRTCCAECKCEEFGCTNGFHCKDWYCKKCHAAPSQRDADKGGERCEHGLSLTTRNGRDYFCDECGEKEPQQRVAGRGKKCCELCKAPEAAKLSGLLCLRKDCPCHPPKPQANV